MGSECPLNVLTHSPDRLSHNLTTPSLDPVATYDVPSHVKHVAPMENFTHQTYVKENSHFQIKV